jgi:phage terminase small subunit
MDDRERAWRRVRSEGFSSIGSQGQEILHPLVRQINQWDKDILALQDRFGLNPKSRLQLGISLNNAKKTTLDLQKEFSINIDDEEWYAETD